MVTSPILLARHAFVVAHPSGVRRYIAALLVATPLLPGLALSQTAGGQDCQAANVQYAEELLQALTAARSRRSSLSLGLKLIPIELQLRTLKTAQPRTGNGAVDCTKLRSQIEAEHQRLVRLLPELPVVAPAAESSVASTAPPVVSPPPPLVNSARAPTCADENEQSRAHIARRFVQFMQMAKVPISDMVPYQDFSRRLVQLDSAMATLPDSCSDHRATLAQANTELQQLMAMEAQPTSALAPNDSVRADSLAGTMPLLTGPSSDSCIAELRRGLREVQNVTSGLLTTRPEGPERAQAQSLLDRAMRQQVDTFGRSPLSLDACEQARGGMSELRTWANLLRDGAPPASARPMLSNQVAASPPQARPTLQAQTPTATARPAVENPLGECLEAARRVYGDLEREGRRYIANGRATVPEAANFEKQLDDYRKWLRESSHPIQCNVVGNNMQSHLASIRNAAATQPAPAPAAANSAAPPRLAGGQAPTAAAPAHAAAPPPRTGPALPAPAANAVTATSAPAPKPPVPPVSPAPARPAAAAPTPPAPRPQAAPLPPPPPAATTKATANPRAQRANEAEK